MVPLRAEHTWHGLGTSQVDTINLIAIGGPINRVWGITTDAMMDWKVSAMYTKRDNSSLNKLIPITAFNGPRLHEYKAVLDQLHHWLSKICNNFLEEMGKDLWHIGNTSSRDDAIWVKIAHAQLDYIDRRVQY